MNSLLVLISEMPEYGRLLEEIKNQGEIGDIPLLNAAKPYLISALYQDLKVPLIVITAKADNASRLKDQIVAWCGSENNIDLFPEPDTLPYQRVTSDNFSETEKIRLLSGLLKYKKSSPQPLIIMSAQSLMQKVNVLEDFSSSYHMIKLGMQAEPCELLKKWQSLGYKSESVVELPGSMSHRGGILDIYPLTSDKPVRMEFMGNTIDSLRFFDPQTQRSLESVACVEIGLAAELLSPLSMEQPQLKKIIDAIDIAGCNADMKMQYKQDLNMFLEGRMPAGKQFYAPLFNTGNVLDYLPADSLIILDEEQNLRQTIQFLDEEIEQLRQDKLAKRELPRNYPSPYFSIREIQSRLNEKRKLNLVSWGDEPRLAFSAAQDFGGNLPAFVNDISNLLATKKRIVVVTRQSERLSELLADEDIFSVNLDKEAGQVPAFGKISIAGGAASDGWVMNGDTFLFTDSEIFGFIKQRRFVKKRPVAKIKLYEDINPGDYVVHIEHGIAKFSGITRIGTSSIEYMLLEYAEGDRLYVPVDQIDRVGRYIGGSDKTPVLNRLGTQDWAKARQKAQKSVEDVAEELLNLYAAREAASGFAFSPDTVWQQELEASFPYVETPDQMTVQWEVKEDMAKAKPMDRLIMGDVGYGKTEVALRAAFKAVMDNKQVAVLVPTTVLAEQHFATFTQRLKAFPIRVEVLSRFRTHKQQQEIISRLAEGKVDICIGTHRLIQKDVVFKDLGLLIIDEEQRFGVNHKEYLKNIRKEVDVLAMSATPIPRTLHMSLAGVRDMSIIETPPEERLPVRTYVAEYDGQLVKEAVMKEMERNGQVFFVHNRVQSIGMIAGKVRELVPFAKIAVAHGRMTEGELESVMSDFSRGDIDILVCTTIIESGLDVPNANTLIINQADKFGLTQLYQLRGRVGRGANLAYAYFLYDKGKLITEEARQRLNVIYEATELGAGVSIAMKDLEIRGAGNLLGMKQSGHINAVGFSLYTRLLSEAVADIRYRQKGEQASRVKHLPQTTVDLPLNALIPEWYVADVAVRLNLYHRIADIKNENELKNLVQEFGDRFGALPPEVKNLLFVVHIRLKAGRAGVKSIVAEDGKIVIRLLEGLQLERHKTALLPKTGITMGRTQLNIDYKRFGKDWGKALEQVLDIIK
ncbi:MAG: transcription-repair coupling factor [Dehalococcoidales bacterium]|nr:transcription-repair coupling factor [Dehalococcoidales bacterium]